MNFTSGLSLAPTLNSVKSLVRLIVQNDAGLMIFVALARDGQDSLIRTVIARLREGAATMTDDERTRVDRALEAIGQAPL